LRGANPLVISRTGHRLRWLSGFGCARGITWQAWQIEHSSETCHIEHRGAAGIHVRASEDENVRFDALALIREFRIAAALPAQF
jgi:hypothetical protein